MKRTKKRCRCVIEKGSNGGHLRGIDGSRTMSKCERGNE